MEEVKTILEINHLNIAYVNEKGQQRTIVENGGFVVKEGELVLLIGENGSGKSSIFRSIVGDLDKDVFSLSATIKRIKNIFKKERVRFVNSKEMVFDGKRIVDDNSLNYLRRSIGFSRQEEDMDALFEKSVWNNVLDYMENATGYQKLSTKELAEKAQFVYDQLDCSKYCEGNLKKAKLKKCSGGEKKIASILAALSRRDSKLFILDEPINNLDAYHARLLNNYLVDLKNGETKPGILIITHCPMFLDVDRVYELKKGKITMLEKGQYQPKSCYGTCDKALKKYIEEE